MTETEDEFAALMARVRLDDNQALTRLIALYEPAIRRAARVLLGPELRPWLDPTDLVQSVHLQFIRALKQDRLSIGSPRQLRSLAVLLLRHKIIEHWRHRRCQARHDAALAATNGLVEGWNAPAHRELDPARVAEYNDLLDHLYRRLRKEDRRLVAMRLQGYRLEEIAAELGVGPAVVRVRLSRMRKRLREAKRIVG